VILVLLESPYRGATDAETAENVAYARACMRDCFDRWEYPFASHLLYTQPGILNDAIDSERNLGILAGLAWGNHATKTVVYQDRGISRGMKQGIEAARDAGRAIDYRWLDGRSA
jgi:hypothetical protein